MIFFHLAWWRNFQNFRQKTYFKPISYQNYVYIKGITILLWLQMSYPSDNLSNDPVPGSIRLPVSELSFINRNKSESESDDRGQFVHQIHDEPFIQSIHVHDVVWCRVVHPFQHCVRFNLNKLCEKYSYAGILSGIEPGTLRCLLWHILCYTLMPSSQS